jgi:chromosome segregation ATPase
MDLAQLEKQVEWLDGERRKDRQEITALQERLAAVTTENGGLVRRIQQLESNLSAANAQLQRLNKIDEVLDQYRKEMARQVEELEKRRLEAAREDERLRKVDREGQNKSLGDVRKSMEIIGRLEREIEIRKEEEGRVARLVAELQKRVLDFNKMVDDRNRAVTLVEEGRRTDTKRLTDVIGEVGEVRRRIDEARAKLEIIEDIARRGEVRIGEVVNAETDRRGAQTQWMEAQSIRFNEQERAWVELKARVDASLEGMEDYARRVNQYAETNRELLRASGDLRQASELIERRMGEISEMQRLSEDRMRQDWNAFLADDQKRWTTHMLLRDEQWREHDRTNEKQVERVDSLEEQVAEMLDSLTHLKELDANRMQTLLNVIREMAAEYDQQFTKVR